MKPILNANISTLTLSDISYLQLNKSVGKESTRMNLSI